MKTLLRTLAGCGVIALAACATQGQRPAAEPRGKWTPLFDGKTLDGWTVSGKPEGWAVEDGAIACQVMGGSYLYTKQQFENFILSLDFKVSPPTTKLNPKTKKEETHRCNSGVFIRWSDLKNPVHSGIEVQVFDSVGVDKPGKHDCGALYDMVAPTKNVEKPVGQWNHMIITCYGPIISVELNGEKICEMNEDQFDKPHQNPDGTPNKYNNAWKDMPRKGHIGLQDHGHRVWFKDVKIKVLE